MILSFLFFLGVFAVIGISSFSQSQNTEEDYYLASRSISPAFAGLSAVATNNSGYMFIGVIGYTYATGLAAFWLMVGWIAGDFLASQFIHSRLRKATEDCEEVSYAGVLANWNASHHKHLQRLIAIIGFGFMLAYASAQLVAGSKALLVLFDWPTWAGAILGAVIVAAYCFAGGIRASIWTDVAQSIVMLLAMALLLYAALERVGGGSQAIAQMRHIDGFLDWFPRDAVVPGVAGALLFAASWLFAGLSVVGQPHIMVRFMSIRDVGQMRTARWWYYIWFILFYGMATLVGMLSRIVLADPASFDAELALPTMAQQLMPPVLAGVVLAGIFAATISTADSLILACSSALTRDLLPKQKNPQLMKFATLGVTVLALAWALLNRQSVFSLVIFAWSGLASAFAPLLVFLSFGGKARQPIAILAILVGLATAMTWRYLGWHQTLYEGMPGMAAGLLVLWAGNRGST